MIATRKTQFKPATDIQSGDLIFVSGSIRQVDSVETYDRYTLFVWIDGQDDIPLVYDKYEQIEVVC